MDWFKQNPFLGTVAIAAALLLTGGGWLVYSEMARVQALQDEFDTKSSELAQLEASKPFPSQANVDAARREAEQASAAVAELAKEFSVAPDGSADPQAFKTKLGTLNSKFANTASANRVGYSDSVFLGFEKYRDQLPPSESVPSLMVQLDSIAAVISALIDSKVLSIDSVKRQPVDGEEALAANPRDTVSPASSEALRFPSFTIEFKAKQKAFRLGFNRIMELVPPVLLKKVSVANSKPTGPAKATAPAENAIGADEQATNGTGEKNRLQPILGKEDLTVTLMISSAVPPASPTPAPKP